MFFFVNMCNKYNGNIFLFYNIDTPPKKTVQDAPGRLIEFDGAHTSGKNSQIYLFFFVFFIGLFLYVINFQGNEPLPFSSPDTCKYECTS